jgi:hypothetical protein
MRRRATLRAQALLLAAALLAAPAWALDYREQQRMHALAPLVAAQAGGPFEIRPPVTSTGYELHALANGTGHFRFVPGGVEVVLDDFSLRWNTPCAEGRCTGPLRAALLVAGRSDSNASHEGQGVLGFAPIRLSPEGTAADLPVQLGEQRLFIPLPARFKLYQLSFMVKISDVRFVDLSLSRWSGAVWAGESGRRDLYGAAHRAGLAPSPCENASDHDRRVANCPR